MLPAFLLLLAAADRDLEREVKRFIDVLAIVEREAADPVEGERAFFAGAIPGALRALDPHTVFLDPEQFEQLKQLEKATTKGFGSVVSVLPGRVIVLQTLPETPSARAGLAPGDEILAINGVRLAALEFEQLVQFLGETRKKEAKLDVRRAGRAGLLQFTMVPEEMKSPSVERAFLLAPGTGYIRVTAFESTTGTEVREAVEKLGGAALKGLVLDLRNNPGGLLAPALETAAMFLEPNLSILSVRGRKVETQEIKVPANAQPYRFPLAVLVNEKSASASEIFAGAVQDHKRGTIVGTLTFGKGLVQSVFPLAEGAGLALTTAYYYSPKGRPIQKPLAAGALAGETAGAEGGIRPDKIVYPEAQSRLRLVLEATGSFATFATEALRSRGPVTAEFAVTPEIMDRFQVFLSERNIRPAVGEWSSEHDWIRSRLRQEILNQGVGIAEGDEEEARRDPQVRAAGELLK